MKKFLLTFVCVAGLVVGALLIWKIVLPFLGAVLGALLPG